MTTFNGKQENLVFKCGSCNNEEIEVNPENKNDMKTLSNWLLTHSYNGGTYKCIKIKNECELCNDKVTYGQEYVTNEGKVVCHNCAKDVSKVFLERQ